MVRLMIKIGVLILMYYIVRFILTSLLFSFFDFYWNTSCLFSVL